MVSLGERVHRKDAFLKVTGSARFTADLAFPGMLVARIVRSPHAHARIASIDCSRASRVRGVRAVVTGEQAPWLYNLALRDQPFLATGRVRYAGEPVVAIAAEDEDSAAEAAALVQVDYEPLPAVLDAREAMGEDAPVLHPDLGGYVHDPSFVPVAGTNVCNHFRLRKGDPEEALRAADHVFDDTYYSHAIQHAALEPRAVIAQWDRDDQLTVWSSQQSPWFALNDLSLALGLPQSKIRVVAPYIGGGFGGKHGLVGEPAAIALAACVRGRPVKLVYGREEEFSSGLVRGPVHIRLRTGVDADGTIVGRVAEVVWDTGAYANVGPLLCRNGSYSSTGPYRIPDQAIDGYCVYTNKVVTGAFRGYGVMEMAFAYESQMDAIARTLGIDPTELRRRNLLRDGDETSTGEVVRSSGLEAALDRCARAVADWGPVSEPSVGRAIVLTAKSSVAPSGSSTLLRVNDDGTVVVYVSTTEMGQGSQTVMAQLAAETLGARLEDVTVVSSDTAMTPPDRSTSSSRSTFHMGNAVVGAATDARDQMLDKAGRMLEAAKEDLEIRDSAVSIRGVPDAKLTFADIAAIRPGVDIGSIVARGSFVPSKSAPMDLDTGRAPHIVAFWLYSSQAVEVQVDTATGRVRVLRVASVHDTGRTLNPDACETQAEGGAGIATSAAVLEEILLGERGNVANPDFDDYRIMTAADMPPIEAHMVEVPHHEGPFGAKGMGEGPTTGIAAAIANAVEDAIGVRIRELPITPEKVLHALQSRGQQAR
jgi:CO/xanthine dehydrogenase Mo-binding subunit